MSDYPSLSSTTTKWGFRSGKNGEHLADILRILLRCEVESEGISSFLSELASRVEINGDICSLAEVKVRQNRKTRKAVDKGRLGPWINGAKGELDGSQRGLESTAAYLNHVRASAEAFYAFLAEAQKNQSDRKHRIGICKDRVTSLRSRIQQLRKGIEAWDEV